MKRFYQVFLLLQIATVLIIAFAVLPPVQAEEAEQDKSCHQCEMNVRKELKVHLDFYYEILIEKYVPAESEHWQAVRTERDLLQKKLKEAKQRGELLHGEAKDEAWVQQHRNLQESFKAAVEKRDEDQLKQVLPQMIKHYEKLNEHYKQRLDMAKSQ